MVAMLGLAPAASASYGESPIATASAPSIPSFLRTISKMSGAGLDSSASSDDVFTSTRSAMPAMSRYLSSSSFLADEPMATRRPAFADPPQQVGHRRERAQQRQIGGFEALAAPLLHFLAVIPLRVLGQEVRNQLVAALADLAAGLFEADVVAELRDRFVPGERVQIDGVEQRSVEVEDGGFGTFSILRGANARSSRTNRRTACSSPCAD